MAVIGFADRAFLIGIINNINISFVITGSAVAITIFS